MTFTVRVNGRPFRTFNDKQAAMQCMKDFVMWQQLQVDALAKIDADVLKSDMKEAKEVIEKVRNLK